MILLREKVRGIAVSETLEELTLIRDPACAAVIWRRRPLKSFQDWIDGLDPARLPRTRLILQPDAVRDAIGQSCEIARTPASPERERLIDDVAALSEYFSVIMRAPYLRVRLDVIAANACRKFHIDAVTARLLCTYRGTGTQYGVSGGGGDPQQVFTAPTGAPILLRGSRWPEDPPVGLLHRSPPIAGTGETRLLLVLDPINDPVDEDD